MSDPYTDTEHEIAALRAKLAAAEAALSAEKKRGHALWEESRANERRARERADAAEAAQKRAESTLAAVQEAAQADHERLARERDQAVEAQKKAEGEAERWKAKVLYPEANKS